MVDLCSGSGAIALALASEVGNSDVYAVEKSPEAFQYLTKNLADNEELLSKVNSKFIAINADIEEQIKDLENLKFKVDALVEWPCILPL